ncbi:MAG TPA: hypothetical protein VGO35_01120 [Gammaproteobacteria bacterium]|jgi:hypothetical protein|nr:hypothetical protein [Gammaproteobacteria bacterium]
MHIFLRMECTTNGTTVNATRREAIHAGRWDRYAPKSVRISVTSFMVKDFEGNSRWCGLTKGQYLQGIVKNGSIGL